MPPSPTVASAAPQHVEPPARPRCRGSPARAPHDHEHRDRQRHIDQEGPRPRVVVDQAAAQHRPERRGDAAEARPGADRAAALLLGKRRADQRQAARHQQRARRRPAPPARRSAAARWRDSAQPTDASAKIATPMANTRRRPKRSPSDAADQQQRRQEQRIRLHHPLRLERRGAQLALDRRQRHVDDGAVDERHARADDRRRPAPSAWTAAGHGVAVAAVPDQRHRRRGL